MLLVTMTKIAQQKDIEQVVYNSKHTNTHTKKEENQWKSKHSTDYPGMGVNQWDVMNLWQIDNLSLRYKS